MTKFAFVTLMSAVAFATAPLIASEKPTKQQKHSVDLEPIRIAPAKEKPTVDFNEEIADEDFFATLKKSPRDSVRKPASQ